MPHSHLQSRAVIGFYKNIFVLISTSYKKYFIVFLYFKNIITYNTFIESSHIWRCRSFYLVPQIKKLRPTLDSFALAFPLSRERGNVFYISVRLTGQFPLKSKTRHTSDFQTSVLMKWLLKSWDKEVNLDIYASCIFLWQE